MKAFFVACLAAAVLAIGGVVMLDHLQRSSTVSFTTSAVRI